MDQTKTNVTEARLMGIQVRTSNSNEMNPLTAQIGPCVQRYWQEGIADQLPNRVKPGRLFAAYFDYETDHNGEYTYFIGEEVASFDDVPEGVSTLTIPAGTYTKFTTLPAPIPHFIMDAWYKIWQMDEKELDGKRKFDVDFEVYDERALNPMAAIVDIYVGTK